MKALVWTLTAALIALWSFAAWIVYGLVGVAGGLAASNTGKLPADPALIAWASWLATAGTGIGEWLVIAIWGFVSLLLVAMGFVAAKLVALLTERAMA